MKKMMVEHGLSVKKPSEGHVVRVGFAAAAWVASLWILPVVGADIAWDGEAGDAQWGNPTNWAGDVLPGSGDRVMISTNGLTAADKRIFLGGDRSIKEVYFYGADNRVILDGEGSNTLRIANGSVSGASYPAPAVNSVFGCDLILGATGTWAPTDNWLSNVHACGRVTDEGNGYGVTFSGQQNRCVTIGGAWNILGALTVQNNTTRIGDVYTNALGDAVYGGSVTNASAIILESRLGFSDNTDTILTLENAYQAADDRVQGVPLLTSRSGGSLVLSGNSAAAVHERLPRVDIQSGRLSVTVNGKSASVATELTVESLTRTSGTAMVVGFSLGGLLHVEQAANTNGMWQPWCLCGSYYTKVSNDYAIVSTVDADYATPAAAGNDAASLYRLSTSSLALEASGAMWGLRWDGSSAQTLDLGTNDLLIGSGSMIVAGSLNKRIVSNGGKLIFGGEDIVYYVDGSGSFTNSAPVAWSKPAGSSVTRPGLVFVRASRTDGIVFDGPDLIGEYGGVYANSYNSARRKITFAGSGERAFYGSLSGVFDLEQKGDGVLTLGGPDLRRSGSLTITGGRVILAYASAPRPTVTNAVCEVALGITSSTAPILQAGSVLAGLGTFGASTTLAAGLGLGLAPGSRTVPGGLGFGSGLSISGDLRMDVRIGAVTNDAVLVTGNFTKPASGSTLTFRLSDVSGGTATIRGRSFVVFRWSGTLANAGNTLLFAVENATPKRLDTSLAVVTLDSTAKTITITGLRPAAGGTLVSVL